MDTDSQNVFFQHKELPASLQQQGFGLELEVKKIFEERARSNYNEIIHHNYAINGHIMPEIDVYAIMTGHDPCCSPTQLKRYHFVVECKGANLGSELYLNESNDSVRPEYSLITVKDERLIKLCDYGEGDIYKRPIGLYLDNPYSSHYVRISYGGDFYDGNGAKKADRNYDKSNIFKGESQLITACSTLSKTSSLENGDFVIPLIVTNRNIKIADHDKKIEYLVPWALNKISNANLDLNNYIPYVLICSLNNLREFLESVLSPGLCKTGVHLVESVFRYPEIYNI